MKPMSYWTMPIDAPRNGVYIGNALGLAELLERLAEWAVIATLYYLGDADSYASEHPGHEDDADITFKLAAGIRAALAAKIAE